MVGGLIYRHAQFLRQFLQRAEGVRNEDSVLANSLPDEGRSSHRAAGAFDDDIIAILDPCSPGDIGMDLNQTNSVLLLSGEGPLSDPGEMDHARSPDHPHQRKFSMHFPGRQSAKLYDWGEGLWIDRISGESVCVFDRRVTSGDFRVSVEDRQCAVPDRRQFLIQLPRINLN